MKKIFAVFVALLSLSIAAVAFLPEQQKNLISEIFVEPTYNSLSGREGNDGEILESRTAPTNMVLRADLLLETVRSDGREIATSRSVGWNFGDLPSGGIAITEAKVSWPAAGYEVKWSIEEKRWLVFNNGVPNMSASGVQHGPTTFLIQTVEILPSEYGDKLGGVTPYSKTIGTGTGFVLRDGKYFPATWSRPDELAGTTWRALDGSEIPFARGQVWIALTEKNPEFTLDSAPVK